jgi:kumamolisin
MKHIGKVAVALGTGLFLGCYALAQSAQSPLANKELQHPAYSVVVPDSSLFQPEDSGKVAHTNTRFISPKALNLKPRKAFPAAGPPVSGDGFETPGSLSCLYGLVAITAGCNPNTATTISARAMIEFW